MTNYSFTDLENIWTQAGGNPVYKAMAAAVALAESGGNPSSTNNNGNGSVDRGLWQINSIHGSQSTYDVQANARAAVSISSNGTNWKPWCSAWSNNACGGTFLGAGAHVLKYLPSGSSTGGTAVSGEASASTSASGGTGDSSATATGLTSGTILDPATWQQAVLKPIGMWAWYGAMTMFGAALLVAGIILLIKDTALVAGIRAKADAAGETAASTTPVGAATVAAKKSVDAKKSPKQSTSASTEYAARHRKEYQGKHSRTEPPANEK